MLLTFTIAPPSAMCWTAAAVTRAAPNTLMSNMSLARPSFHAPTSEADRIPAQFTTAVKDPKRVALFTVDSTLSSEVTSR